NVHSRGVAFNWGMWWLADNDVMGMHVRTKDDFEREEQIFIQKFIRPGMTALDLGAHHGLYTLLLSRLVGPTGRVIAFEPSPRERRKLKLHVILNRCTNVLVEPFALGDNDDKSELFLCLGRETGCNSLRRPVVSDPVRKVMVKMTTLNCYFQKGMAEKVDFIKVDVEGAELPVFKSASILLKNSKPIILCELDDQRTEPWGYSSSAIYDFLFDSGYRWYSIVREGKLNPCPKKTRYHENLLAVPEEKLRLLEDYFK
ncbi:FkbM family methyltransferase, partial [candidate division CSSED10-310 bacterium]